MKPPKVMTPMGPLHLPVSVRHPTEGWCWQYEAGEHDKWEALARGVQALPGQPFFAGQGTPALQGLIHALPPPPRPDTSGRVLTMAAVALLLGIPTAREARKFLRRNGLKPVKVGRKFFIGKAAVEDFILGQEKSPTPGAIYAPSSTPAGDLAAAKLSAVDRLDARRRPHAEA